MFGDVDTGLKPERSGGQGLLIHPVEPLPASYDGARLWVDDMVVGGMGESAKVADMSCGGVHGIVRGP